MSQKEFHLVKVIENAAFERASGAAAETRLSARFLELGAAWQSRTLHALGSPQKQLILTLARGNYQGLSPRPWPEAPVHGKPEVVQLPKIRWFCGRGRLRRKGQLSHATEVPRRDAVCLTIRTLEISGIFARRAGRRAGRPVQQRRASVRGPTPSRLLSCLCAWLIRLP